MACRSVAHHLDLIRQAWYEGDAKQLELLGMGMGSETGGFEHFVRDEFRAEVHRLREKLEHDLDYLPLILPYVDPGLRDRLCRLMSALDLDRSVATDEGKQTAWRLPWLAMGLDSEINELISILKAEGDRISLEQRERETLLTKNGGTESRLPTDDRSTRLRVIAGALRACSQGGKLDRAGALIAEATRLGGLDAYPTAVSYVTALEAGPKPSYTAMVGDVASVIHKKHDLSLPSDMGSWLLPIADELEAAANRLESQSQPFTLSASNADIADTLARMEVALAAQPKKSPRVYKPDGWTQSELVDYAREVVPTFSPSTFSNIRKAAKVKPSQRGGSGPHRRFTRTELKMMIAALRSGTFQNRDKIADCWSELLDQ